MAGISPVGNDWPAVKARLATGRNAVCRIAAWGDYEGLNTQLGAPVKEFTIPAHYSRKATRSMGRVALMATRTAEFALQEAGLLGDPIVRSGRVGISYGSASGTPDALGDFSQMLVKKTTVGINANTYLKMMSHTAAVNIGVFFGVRGRILPTSSACTSGSQAIGYAYESIKFGRQVAMIAGGAEELSPSQAAIFDTLFAVSGRNASPEATPRPFDRDRDGLVVGEGACTLILEDLDHARARGATIHAEIVGYGTNSDGIHVTQSNANTMRIAMELAFEDACLSPEAIGYISAHGTATTHGDIEESVAVSKLFGNRTPISSLKSYMGHTMGACGALEAWMTIGMMNVGCFFPTVNLDSVDPACADLDYIRGEARTRECEYVMTNNFAFGGVNTSLIFRRWR
jgi:3-oxoacyl-[acyl-carrier-protein] synthase II